MTISDILEHWATIYKPLSHTPTSERLEDQRFFRVRSIDLENVFERNYNIIQSPCMLQSITMTGELKSAKQSDVSHQIWFMAKVTDSAATLGRFDSIKIEQTAQFLVEICEDFASWLIEVRRTQTCPITKQSFKSDPQLAMELSALDINSISYGVVPDFYKGKWLIAGLDWHSLKPLYNFACGSNGKYNAPNEDQP